MSSFQRLIVLRRECKEQCLRRGQRTLNSLIRIAATMRILSIARIAFTSQWFPKNKGSLHFALLAAAGMIGPWMQASVAQLPSSQPASGSTIQGTVLDSAGQAVADASVKLERQGSSGFDGASTHSGGSFSFSGLGAGTYLVSAEKAGSKSRKESIVLTADENVTRLNLVLNKPATDHGDPAVSTATSNQTMEFADQPNFTVAAVTDWTAAGGHGSDSSLRTSEALTRETLTLKSADAKGGPGSSEADRHRKAGEQDERMGDPLAAVHEFEQAVRLEPNEQNYFEWGSELLLHRAIWQAKEVFEQGAKAYPGSARMLTALGATLFAGALYDDAALRLCDASDLNPKDPEPYVFMGKIEIASPSPLPCIEQKLARFVEIAPENALANYFYAMAIWKQKGQPTDELTVLRVEAMLNKAVLVDNKCADAYLQLGVLNASQQKYAKAIGFYGEAIAANPQSSEAHYRLGVAYDRIGEHAKAKEQFQLHDDLDKEQKAVVERQRREVKQFLVVVPGQATDKQTP